MVYVTRSIIVEFIGSNSASGRIDDLFTVSTPIKKCIRTRFIHGNPRNNHSLAYIISLCNMYLEKLIHISRIKELQEVHIGKKSLSNIFNTIIGETANTFNPKQPQNDGKHSLN